MVESVVSHGVEFADTFDSPNLSTHDNIYCSNMGSILRAQYREAEKLNWD